MAMPAHVLSDDDIVVADDVVTERVVDLQTLAALVIQNDPALEAFRGAIADADFRVAGAARGRDPEVRLRYGELSGWSVPGSYTETSSEAIKEDGLPFVTSMRETTTRVTPHSTGETVEETVTEWGYPRSESVEQRNYGRDAYPGRSSFSVQLRLFPSNPFMEKAARDQQVAVRDEAKLGLETELQRAALAVAREHREIQFMLAELKLMRRQAKLLTDDLKGLSELKAAFAISPVDYHKRRTEALIYLSRLNELKGAIGDASARLKARATLGESDRIAFAGNLYPPGVNFGLLDQDRLVELAMKRNPDLGSVRVAKSSVDSDIRAHRAESIPWLSSGSVNVGGDDSDNGQTRDEWGVYAGVNLPVGAWLDGKSRQALESRRKSLDRQELATRLQLEFAVRGLCQSIVSAQSDWDAYADGARATKSGITQQMESIVGNDLTTRRMQLGLNESLIEIEEQRIRLAHRLSLLLFDLCDTIGCDLDLVLATGMAGASE